ncbi:hypothetical protein BDF20DRAFT_348383 [Mycotypha africana]|uniref:uncharacterized protein n=1 Tax=Mycotypha africana TaxID=64632 RepID=UPI0023015023|nr:uncharacterized protein BDF20DRAFT_348383 [Mycotypha africana]KAI8967031.1 hypothetical protein BDF20DRAFT_348383 [Mycotypha africana]
MSTLSISNDICSQVNLLSSIQHQQKELEKLAALLNSEEDREQYKKVIELSKIAQARLDYLLEKKKTSLFDVKIVKLLDSEDSHKNHVLDRKSNSRYYDNRNSRQSDCSDATLVPLLNGNSKCSNNSLTSHLIGVVDDKGGGKNKGNT